MQDLLRKARLVTLIGPGGIGKTRLALELSRTLELEVAFIDFASLQHGNVPSNTSN